MELQDGEALQFSREKTTFLSQAGRGAGLVLARIKKHPLPSDYEVRGFKVMSTSTIRYRGSSLEEEER